VKSVNHGKDSKDISHLIRP